MEHWISSDEGTTRAPSISDLVERLHLRDFQEEALHAALDRLADRTAVQVIEVPTGGGKTFIAVALIAYLLATNWIVLWVCKHWHLLKQAADAVLAHFPELRSSLRRFGGADTPLRHLPEGAGGKIIFTTLQTWRARRHNMPDWLLPAANLAVVWDEVHWGIFSTIGQAFRQSYLGVSPIFGLTATPVVGHQVRVAYFKAPEALWGSILAKPLLHEVVTGINWTPEQLNEDFSPRSLRILGADDARNECIVRELIEGMQEGRYARVLIFACDISHAQTLGRTISQKGFASRVIHSRQGRKERDEAVSLFRSGKVSVLVNIAILTVGFDLPEVDAVFLARPTQSGLLLRQMIGRGARKAPGKDSFHVVDFTDNLQRFADRAVRARMVLKGKNTYASRRLYRSPKRHEAPTDSPRFVNLTLPGQGALPIAIDQTFGAEIELTTPYGTPKQDRAWSATAKAIIERVKETAGAGVHRHPGRYRRRFTGVWQVKFDSSAGWEVVPPVLSGEAGIEELGSVCEGLTALVSEQSGRLHLNFRTGLHVTLATRLHSNEQFGGLIKRVQRLEPGLFTLTAPSRLYPYLGRGSAYLLREGNQYCRPLRQLCDVDQLCLDAFVADRQNRYHTVNLTKCREDVHLVEVRMHGGTLEVRKIALWLSLWMQIINCSRYDPSGSGACGTVFPGGNQEISRAEADREDIIQLLAAEGIPLTQDFERLLRERRQELRPRWEQAIPRRVASWDAAGWHTET